MEILRSLGFLFDWFWFLVFGSFVVVSIFLGPHSMAYGSSWVRGPVGAAAAGHSVAEIQPLSASAKLKCRDRVLGR